MKRFIKATIRMIQNMHPARQLGIIALIGTLLGLQMMRKIPEFCDGLGPLAVSMLGVIGFICVEYAEVILPTPPQTDKKDGKS